MEVLDIFCIFADRLQEFVLRTGYGETGHFHIPLHSSFTPSMWSLQNLIESTKITDIMTKRVFSWLVAIVAMTLLVPVKGMAYEVGDEFELSFNGTSKQYGVVENAITLTFTVTDPANHKVAIWKRNSSSVEVTEDNIIQTSLNYVTGKSAIKVNSSFNAYSLPDEVTAPDGEVYTISAIGSNALQTGHLVTRLPHNLELVGRMGVKDIYNIDFSQMPLLRIVGTQGLGLYIWKNSYDGHIEDICNIVFENAAIEEIYDKFLYWSRNAYRTMELDFSKMPKLKKIHYWAFSPSVWHISSRELHIPAHIEWMETGAFEYTLTYPLTDVYFEHTSANSIEWKKTYTDNYYNVSSLDFPLTTTNIHVCDEILQQCKNGTRTDEFASYYRKAPSIIDPEAPWQNGRAFFVTTPIGDGTVDLEYTISDYDKREVWLYHSPKDELYGTFGPEKYYNTNWGSEFYIGEDDELGSVNYVYNIGSGFRIAYSNYTVNTPSDLVIPETVTGTDGETYTVVNIGGTAFNGCKFLRNVTLPQTLRTISQGAFYWSSLTTANLGELENLSYIGDRAFYETHLSGDLELPDGVTELLGNTFTRTNITSFKSNKLKVIGYKDFFDCPELTTVTLDDDLETIGEASYKNSNHILENLEESYGDGSFACCPKLATVNFSDAGNLWYIGGCSFYCTALSGTITIPEGVKVIGRGNIGTADLRAITKRQELRGAFGDTNVTKIIYPSSLVYDYGSVINTNTSFDGQKENGIRYSLIEADLSKCKNLKKMEGTFLGCFSLTKVTLPDFGNLKEMSNVFFDCTSITGELVIPEGVEIAIGNDNCGFSKITYPKSVKEIGACKCQNLTTVNFGELENLNKVLSFKKCNLQGEISLCSKVWSIASDLFNDNPGITKVTYPAVMEYFNGSAFVRCPGVTDVYIKRYDSKAQYLSINDNDYYKVMNNPTGTKLHVSQRIIDECKAGVNNGFLNWYNANPDCLVPYDEASLPTSTSVKMQMPLVNDDGEENGETANLLFTIIDSDKREIGLFTKNLYSYYDEDGYATPNYPEYYIGDEDFLYNSNGKNTGGGWCVRDMTGEGFLILPETLDLKDGHTYTLTMIGSRAVQGRYNYNYVNYQSSAYDKLLGIVIPKTVRRIGDYAFSGNSKLGMVWFDDDSQLEHIGKYAFNSLNYPVVDFTMLPKLKIIDDGAFNYTEGYGETLNLGTTVEVIGEEAFAYTKLKGTVELPASLKRLGARAFYYNKDVSRVNFNNLKPWDLTWEGSGDKSENFASTTVVGCSQGIIDQCKEGTRQDQFMAYYPNQLISIGSYLVVDLNGDGKTDGKDVIKLLDIISGKEPTSADADLNNDGKVDIADMILLMKKMME